MHNIICKCFKIYKMITCCIPEATKGVKRCDPRFLAYSTRRPRCAASLSTGGLEPRLSDSQADRDSDMDTDVADRLPVMSIEGV